MKLKMWKVILLVAMVASLAAGATYTVSKPGGFGAYNSISAAVAAAKDGDEVVIVDLETYEEQVTILNLKNFTLRSENPTSLRKPKIVWKDIVNVLPKVKEDAKDSARINFDQNGALRVMRSNNITIEGIAVDGGGNFPFASQEDVWENIKENKWYPMQHGNAAIVLWIAGGVTVRHCDLSNAFFGISFKDRNEGGIFANSNPADIQTWKVVPLSGFAKTGDHVIEYNRIHDNSIGIFFESTWDLGTVIRYNLMFENHHPAGKSAAIKGMTNQGEHLIGCAMMFKDHILSPLTIHNNTFWHNGQTFIGNWRCGGHYLVFNNIVGEPYIDGTFKDPWQVLDPHFPNRMFNCVYACQKGAPQEQIMNVQVRDTVTNTQVVKAYTVYQPEIMNGFGQVESKDIKVPIELSYGTVYQTLTSVKVEGCLIASTTAGGYTAANKIVWLETKFKSIDPDDAEFLEPDWADSLVNSFIVDKGYDAVGITDPDGTPADLGAIPKDGGIASNKIRIKPTTPVSIKNGTAMVSFVLEGAIVDPKIKYIKWIHELPVSAVFGQKDVIIPKSDIIDFTTVPAVKVGNNALTFTVPARSDSNLYAFFELVIEGTDPVTNLPVQSVVGSLPYRKIDYEFEVEIFDLDATTKLTTVAAGQPVILRITPIRLDDTPWDVSSPVEKTDVSLFSTFDLLDGNDVKIAVPRFTKSYETQVKFTRVPEGGLEIVSVAGLFKANNDTLAIRGSSDPITVKPGVPDSLRFQDPPSGGFAKVDPGKAFDVEIQVYDKYGNAIDQETDVTLISLEPNEGDIDGGGPKTSKTDTTGVVYFKVKVTEGSENDTFPLRATLDVNGKLDNASLIVGKARDRLVIFFEEDSAGTVMNPAIEISGCSDQRVPIVVKRIGVINDIALVMAADTDTVTFDIEKSNGIGIYATSDPNDNTIAKSATTVAGQVTLWIKATGLNVSNGSINMYPVSNPAVLSGERGKINFNPCNPGIDSAAYFADSGDGRVNRLEIYYEDTLSNSEIPDTFQLYWPHNQGDPKIIVGTDLGSVSLDASNKKHLTVRLNDPFNPIPMITSYYTQPLGTSIWQNPLLPEAPSQKTKFDIEDKVGPILTSAVMVENMDRTSDDTLFINISEVVKIDLIIGATLRVTKQNIPKQIDLQIKDATKMIADTIRIIVASLGNDSISEGDSLSIIASGTILDENANHANENNRPVVIRLRTISPSIYSAYYKDVNGNGIVDLVTVLFNKKIKTDSIGIRFNWIDGSGNCTISGQDKIVYANDSSTVMVNVEGLMAGNKVKTSGAMSVEATYLDYDSATSDWSVDDSAAPVIIESTLYPGSVGSDDVINKDTLKVQFSEHIESVELSTRDEFFQFYSNANPYKMKLTKYREEGESTISFIVDTILITPELLNMGFNFPKNGDSTRILVGENGILADNNGSFQIVELNRMAALIVKPVPTDADVKVGPIPFNLENGDSVRFIVKPKAKMVEGIITTIRVVIYDRAGNKLFDKEQVNTNGIVELAWYGYNAKGKKVGVGTYLAKVNYSMKAITETGALKETKGSKTFKIAAGNKKFIKR